LSEYKLIEFGGVTAHPRAYAFDTEEVDIYSGGEYRKVPKYTLYYLDMVGRSAEVVRAITHGLVNFPPKSARLFNLQGEQGITVWAADTEKASERKLYQATLRRSCGYQAVMVASIGLNLPPDSREGENEKKRGANRNFFLILLLEEVKSQKDYPVSQIYYERLNLVTSIPILSEWHDWLWGYVTQNDLVKKLTSYGCEAYLCQVPDENLLAQEIEIGIVSGKLRANEIDVIEGDLVMDCQTTAIELAS
jgi:hypothetical protein